MSECAANRVFVLGGDGFFGSLRQVANQGMNSRNFVRLF